MDGDTLLTRATSQLQLVLSFFPRVDGRTTAVLSIDIAMIAFLAANTPGYDKWSWLMLIALVPLVLLGRSLWGIYQCTYPNLEGGRDSLVYFHEIASHTESGFIEKFSGRSNAEHAKDILGQVWRNAEILKIKYRALRDAHIYLGWALIPWVITLLLFASINHNPRGLFQ